MQRVQHGLVAVFKALAILIESPSTGFFLIRFHTCPSASTAYCSQRLVLTYNAILKFSRGMAVIPAAWSLTHECALVAEEFVAEQFRNLADSLVELYHGVRVAPSAGYDADLETFSLYTKTCTMCARQVYPQPTTCQGRHM